MKGLTRVISIVSILLLLLVLGACSSGGGDSAPPPPPPPGPPATTNLTIGGTGVKGIIKHARVNVFAIEDDGSVASQPLATTTTNEFGDYSINFDTEYSGPVMVVISNNNDVNNPTTMTCDVTTGCGTVDPIAGPEYAFGDDMPLGSVELKAVVPNADGSSTFTAAVTPFTHMAAAYAEQLSGGLTSENIATANSKVGNMLGINNIVTTIPPDITSQTPTDSSFNESKYAYLSAAIASLAQQNYEGDISAVLNALVSTYTTNDGELIGSESLDSTSVISLAELAYHAMMQANLNGADGQVEGALDSLHWMAQSTTDTPTSTSPSPTTGLGDLEVVKAFVADVRTWGNVIDQEIQNNASEFQQRVDMAEITFDIATPLLSDAFEFGFTAAFEAYVAGASADTNLASYFDPTDPVPVAASGSVTVTENAATTTVVLDGDINGIHVSFIAEGPMLDSNGNLIGTQFVLEVSNVLVENPAALQNRAQITADSGTVTVSYANSYPAGIDLTPWLNGTQTGNGSVPDPDSGAFDLVNVTITEVDVTDPVSYSGSLQAEIVGSQGNGDTVIRDIFGNVVQYNPASIDFTGELSNTANSITAHIAATMPNADTFMPIQQTLQLGYVHTNIGSYSFSNNNNTLTITTPGLTRTFTYDQATQTVTYYHSSGFYNGDWVLPNTYTSFNAFLTSGTSTELTQSVYTWIDGEGEYVINPPAIWELAGGTLDGTLTVVDSIPDEDASNFRQLSDINVTFVAQLEGLPEARFEVTGNRTGFEAGDINLVIAYGGRRIEANGNIANGDVTGNIDITNQDGVVISYERENTGTPGGIYYNNAKYADIEEVNGITIIRYIDGYFDSL
ncbi:hypothetical protein [Kaarinaea lacus]